MASSKDYLCTYKKFFEDFAASIEPYDQLPVKVAGYFIRDSEVTGEIVDWTLQYLSQKRCPSSLLTPLVKIVIDEMKVACAKKAADCGFVAHENVYQPLRLMNAAMTKVNEVCLRYKDNGQLHTLPEPAPKSYISACAIKNSRRRMEDRHVVIEDFHGIFGIKDCGPASYFAVFDGHAGVDAASYSVSHLHQFLAESRYYPADPERALKDAFFRTDSLFIEKSNMENLHSGTTAVCALLRPNDMLYVAWLGDSQALLVRRGQPISIVNPHKPDRKDERKRIEGMGGSVLFWGTWRVNGQLAVSRAIGDVEYKPYVTAEPDVVAVPLDGTEDFLILGCDGLWDFVPEEAIVHAVYEQLKNSPGKGAILSGSRLYEGDWSRGLKHGYGVLSHKICEGTYVIDYAGDWVHGNKQGKGVYHYPDGGFYEGGWKANRRSGYGCMWFADNTFYSGDWLDDRFHGLGLFVQADGDRYEGHWECGVRSGFGRFYHLRTGQLQEGWWRDGVAVRGTVVDLRYRQSALHPTPYPIPKVEVKEPDKIFDDLDEAGKSLNSEQEIALA